MRIAVAMTAVALALGVSAPAMATSVFPGQRLANNAMVNSIDPLARKFWADRGVKVRDDIVYMLADDLGDQVLGYADLNGQVIWLRTEIVAAAQTERFPSFVAREYLFMVIAHEQGHIAGLLFPDGPDPDDEPDIHSATGLMSWNNKEIPWAARQWRRSLDTRRRIHCARHRHRRSLKCI